MNRQSRAPEPAPGPAILRLSPELLLTITDHLSVAQGAALFATCKSFSPLVHRGRFRSLLPDSTRNGQNTGSPWRSIHGHGAFLAPHAAARDWLSGPAVAQDPASDRIEFLLLLERDMPGYFVCMTGCELLHRSIPLRDRAFTCPYEPRDCEEAECTSYLAGFMVDRPRYVLSAGHIHRVFQYLRTRRRSGAPVSSLAASTRWTQGYGDPAEDDQSNYEGSDPWRKLVVEPYVDRFSGHVQLHIVQRLWKFYDSDYESRLPGTGELGGSEDDFSFGFTRSIIGPRWPWWSHELSPPCVHMLQHNILGDLRSFQDMVPLVRARFGHLPAVFGGTGNGQDSTAEAPELPSDDSAETTDGEVTSLSPQLLPEDQTETSGDDNEPDAAVEAPEWLAGYQTETTEDDGSSDDHATAWALPEWPADYETEPPNSEDDDDAATWASPAEYQEETASNGDGNGDDNDNDNNVAATNIGSGPWVTPGDGVLPSAHPRVAPTTRRKTWRHDCASCPSQMALTVVRYGADGGPLAEGVEVVLDSWLDLGCRLPSESAAAAAAHPRCVYRCWPVRHDPGAGASRGGGRRPAAADGAAGGPSAGQDDDDDDDDDDDEGLVPFGPRFWTPERKAVFPTGEGVAMAGDLPREAPQALLTWREGL